jgi:hypothetical protein
MYNKASRLWQRPTAREDYQKWFIGEYADCLGTFATFTFPRPVSRNTALCKGKRLVLQLNKRVFGNHFERRGEGLVCIFSVEGELKIGNRIVNPHLHYLIGKHPLVTPERIKDVWSEIAGRKAARIGVKVEPIDSVEDATRYILKKVSWEHGPEVYIPYDPKTKELLR